MRAAPTDYTDAERQDIIEGALISLAAGQSLRSYCLANNLTYSFTWGLLNPEDGDNSPYARAKSAGTHYMADECIDIADGIATQKDVPASLDPALVPMQVDINAKVQIAKVQIDTRLRLIGKWNRKDYGDKIINEMTGPNGSPLVYPGVTVIGKLPGDKSSEDEGDS